MSKPRVHIHLPYTTYFLCKKDGGINGSKSNATCKTCIKLYKSHKDLIFRLSNFSGGISANHILKEVGFIK